jgi:hypothetical protein
MADPRKRINSFLRNVPENQGVQGVQLPDFDALRSNIKGVNIPPDQGGFFDRPIFDNFKNTDYKDVFNRSLGDIAGLINFSKNKTEIENLPITQPFTQVGAVQEDASRRDASAINEIRRQSRAASLGTQSGSAQREASIRGGIHAGAISEINKVKTQENLRLDSVAARNAGRAQQTGIVNAGIVNEQFGNIQQNLFTQSQARVQNRQTLVDSLLGNKFQRDNQDLERERMVMIALREGDRGVLRQIYTDLLSSGSADPNLIRMIEQRLNSSK